MPNESFQSSVDEFLPPSADTELEAREFNMPIYGTYGEFTLAPQVKVPYMVALMDLKRLTKELKTHEEVSPSLENTYSLTELFQREIDVKRVEDEIVDRYLKDHGKLKFFNALTMVLLPKDDAGKIQADFMDYEGNNPTIPDANAGQFDPFFAKPDWKRSVFGGVQFVSTKTANLSRLRWDIRRVDAVAVDGQHRLKALKVWMEKKNNELIEIEKPTRIPVIFLLLHERVGFLQGDKKLGLKAIAREIFTDLNKNAREVDLATQIVLDDRSLESLCVRSLVTEGTCINHPPLLPLTMVRWQEANNRFDQRYFLNSLVHLHSLVEELLDLEPPRKIDKDAGLKFVKKVQDTLGSGTPRKLVVHEKSLDDHYQENYLDESGEAVAPINGIPLSYLSVAVDGFKDRFSSWLLQLLGEFKPYKSVIEYAVKNDLITGEFGKFLSQPKSHQKELEKELKSRHGDQWLTIVIKQHEDAIQKLKGIGRSDAEGGEYWSFKAIFQKAFVKLGKTVFFDAPDADRARFGTIGEFLEFFGSMHDRGALSVHAPISYGQHRHELWTFISVNPINRKIQVVNTAEKRILALLTISYYTSRLAFSMNKKIIHSGLESDTEIPVKLLIDKLSRSSATSMWPNSPQYIDDIRNLFNANCEFIDPVVIDKTSKKAKQNSESRLNDMIATMVIGPQIL